MAKLGYMALDQWGNYYHIGNNSPRKWLLNHFDRKHADKMYQDLKTGETIHTGWVIAGHWLTVYQVCSLH